MIQKLTSSKRNKPYLGLFLSEYPRAVQERTALAFLKPFLKPKTNPEPQNVVVLPGFLGDDRYTSGLRSWLTRIGYTVHGWEMGKNTGPRSMMVGDLKNHIKNIANASGGPVSLVGHSLGGLYAREIARENPKLVRQVITAGTAFAEDRNTRNTPTAFLFRLLNPGVDENQKIIDRIHVAPPVPVTSIFSLTDGIVYWRHSVQQPHHDQVENVAVGGSHSGLLSNATVWQIIADRLAQPLNRWYPYQSKFAFTGIPFDPTLA